MQVFTLILFITGLFYQIFLIIDINVFKYNQTKLIRNKEKVEIRTEVCIQHKSLLFLSKFRSDKITYDGFLRKYKTSS